MQDVAVPKRGQREESVRDKKTGSLQMNLNNKSLVKPRCTSKMYVKIKDVCKEDVCKSSSKQAMKPSTVVQYPSNKDTAVIRPLSTLYFVYICAYVYSYMHIHTHTHAQQQHTYIQIYIFLHTYRCWCGRATSDYFCVCVCVVVCGCVGLWMCGFVIVWVRDCVGGWLCGCFVIVWMCGCVGVVCWCECVVCWCACRAGAAVVWQLPAIYSGQRA